MWLPSPSATDCEPERLRSLLVAHKHEDPCCKRHSVLRTRWTERWERGKGWQDCCNGHVYDGTDGGRDRRPLRLPLQPSGSADCMRMAAEMLPLLLLPLLRVVAAVAGDELRPRLLLLQPLTMTMMRSATVIQRTSCRSRDRIERCYPTTFSLTHTHTVAPSLKQTHALSLGLYRALTLECPALLLLVPSLARPSAPLAERQRGSAAAAAANAAPARRGKRRRREKRSITRFSNHRRGAGDEAAAAAYNM